MHMRMTCAVCLICRLPMLTLFLSDAERESNPNICLLERKGPHDDPGGPRRARDHEEHWVPRNTPPMHPDRIHPRINCRTEGLSKSYWGPFLMSKPRAAWPWDRMAVETPPLPQYNSRNMWYLCDLACLRHLRISLRSEETWAELGPRDRCTRGVRPGGGPRAAGAQDFHGGHR